MVLFQWRRKTGIEVVDLIEDMKKPRIDVRFADRSSFSVAHFDM